MKAVSEERLSDISVEFSDKSACCVIMASDGYPEKYEKGFEIKVNGELDGDMFIAGAKMSDGKLLTNGGRVLGVTAVADDLKSAVDKAYREIEKVSFENAYYRKDIGKRALEAVKEA